MPRVLLIEDDLALRGAIADLLRSEGYAVEVASNGEEGLDQALTDAYDLVLLDVMLPGLTGYEIAATMRRHRILTPIIMITAKDRVEDRVHGLDAGADDYLVKPFASTELFARVRAQLRRASANFPEGETLTFGNMTYRLGARELAIGAETCRLSPKESILVELFIRHPKVVLTRSQLMDRLWADGSDILDNALEAHVSKLRRKLAAAGGPDIVTVRGLGYRLEDRP